MEGVGYCRSAVLAVFYCGCNQSKSLHINFGGKGSKKMQYNTIIARLFSYIYISIAYCSGRGHDMRVANGAAKRQHMARAAIKQR